MIDSRDPTQGGMIGLREFARFVYRRKYIIFVPAVLIAGITWMIASVTVPRYTASAALTLDVSKVRMVDQEVVSRLPLESSTLRSELDVIRSRSLNDEVVVNLGLKSDPEILREVLAWQSWEPDFVRVMRHALGRFLPWTIWKDPEEPATLPQAQITDWLLGNLNVSNDGRSLTIVVSFTSDSPQRSAQIANEVAKTYLNDQVLAKTRATMMASNWLGERVTKIREELENSEAAVDDFRRQSGLLEVRGATIPAARLADLNAQLSAARSERMRAELNLQTARQSSPEALPDALATPMMQTLRKELADIKLAVTDLQDHGAFYKVSDYQARAAALRAQLNAEMSRLIAGLSGDVAVARQKEAELERSFRGMQSQLGDTAHSGVRLMQLQREADANRSIYETFLARYKQSMEQESLEVPDARLISEAVLPETPSYPNKLRFLLLGTFGGLGVGGALAYFRESFDRRILRASDVESATGIPVFGFLPKVSRWRGLPPQDYPLTDPHSRLGTALVRIHTALRAPQSSDQRQVIVVTSARPGDGKTSFCTGLARSLSKSRKRVLVIDADPYRSQVAKAFGASTAPALHPVNGRGLRLGEIVQSDVRSDAHYIPALSEDDLQFLLHSGGFAALLDEARQAYDIVIIDTPPVLTHADAAALGRFADTCLLLVKWGRTSWDEVTAAVGFLRLCHVRMDGIVMVGGDNGPTGYGPLARYDTAPSESRFARLPSDRNLTEAE